MKDLKAGSSPASSTTGEAIIYENKFPEIFFTSMKIML
jgi:hypothetical protein